MPGNAVEGNGKPQPPNVFLIYNLTKEQMQLLLHRGVWSSLAITFRTLPFSPPCPNFLFSIRGFSTHLESTITTIIQQVWDCNDTKMYITSLINAVPEDKRGVTEAALGLFFDSMWVKRLDIRRAGNTLVPRFNIYADSSAIPIDGVWIRLQAYAPSLIPPDGMALQNGLTPKTRDEGAAEPLAQGPAPDKTNYIS
ncbi:hypothetical protein EDB85DRAFT_2150271 [Lactarius pseudohatsudake]|nr:hypothetical protein EDB85DRAFT_2150271 [Lactarius pseudohatsudake]